MILEEKLIEAFWHNSFRWKSPLLETKLYILKQLWQNAVNQKQNNWGIFPKFMVNNWTTRRCQACILQVIHPRAAGLEPWASQPCQRRLAAASTPSSGSKEEPQLARPRSWQPTTSVLPSALGFAALAAAPQALPKELGRVPESRGAPAAAEGQWHPCRVYSCREQWWSWQAFTCSSEPGGAEGRTVSWGAESEPQALSWDVSDNTSFFRFLKFPLWGYFYKFDWTTTKKKTHNTHFSQIQKPCTSASSTLQFNCCRAEAMGCVPSGVQAKVMGKTAKKKIKIKINP